MVDPTGKRRRQPADSHELLSNEVRIKDGGMKEEGLIEVGQMIRLPRCCWRARLAPLGGSYFNDIIHPRHGAAKKDREHKKENCDGEMDRNKKLWLQTETASVSKVSDRLSQRVNRVDSQQEHTA